MTYDRTALERGVEKLTEKESDHDIHHHRRVYLIARKIAELEGIGFDDDVLHAAAFLHDTGYTDNRCSGDLNNHIIYGMEFASKILPEVGFPRKKIKIVLEAIRMHDDTKPWAIYECRYKKTNIVEVKLIQDADNVEGYGVLGLFRIAGYNNKKGARFYDPKIPFNYEGSRKSAVQNMFYHRDFKGRMHFKSAEAMMAVRKLEMLRTLRILLEEINLKR